MFNKKINPNKLKPNTDFIAQNVVYLKTVNSTNTLAKKTNCENGTLFIAETQTDGKGRMGREWLSEKNCCICMSIVLNPVTVIEAVAQITLVTGLAVCETLNKLFDLKFKIKWPNDIVIDGKKICGILVEGVTEGNKITKLIDGIGINVNQKAFPDELKNKATSLFLLTGKKNDRTKIINSFAEVFESYYTDFIDGNFESLMEKYKALCVTLNSNVTLIQNGETINAVATDITEKGELTVKKEDGTFLNINSGEVSVRGIYGYY